MSTETNKAVLEEKRRDVLEEREDAAHGMSVEEALGIMHGWRFIPDDIELSKRVVYALTVGLECAYVWVYKQVVTYIEMYGIEEFETNVYPSLYAGIKEYRYTMYEVRQEIESVVVQLVQKVYKKHARVFMTKTPKKEDVEEYNKEYVYNAEEDGKYVRAMYLLLQIVLKSIGDVDSRTVEIVVYFGYVLDRRVFDYLATHFCTEKDLLLETLLVKRQHAESGITKQQHMTEEEVEKLYGPEEERKEYTREEEEAQCKKILQELLEDKEVMNVIYGITRCSVHAQNTHDEEIYAKVAEKAKDKNKAVRMQCATELVHFTKYKGMASVLLGLLDDPDDDIKDQARVSVSVCIAKTEEMAEEMIEQYVEWVQKNSIEYAGYLPEIILKAKQIGSKHTETLYEEYCHALMSQRCAAKITLMPKMRTVFAQFIAPEKMLEESMKELCIEKKTEEEDNKTEHTHTLADISDREQVQHRFATQNAMENMQEIVRHMLSILTPNTIDSIVELVAELVPLMSSVYIDKIIEEMISKDADRKWRYWTELIELVESVHDRLSNKTKDKVAVKIAELTKHWAHAVRVAARKAAKHIAHIQENDTEEHKAESI